MADIPVKKRSEASIQQDIRIALGQRPDVLIQRRSVGTFYTRNGTPIKIGHKGEPDLQGVISGQKCPNCGHSIHAKPFGIEVKTASGRQRKDQQAYEKNIANRVGIIYILARSVSDALKGLGIK